MKKWKFFPILVQEKIVAYMFISDIISFAKCSKKCQNLLNHVPIHLPPTIIDDSPQPVSRLIHRPMPLSEFSILATSRKLFVNQLGFYVTTEEDKNNFRIFFEKMTESQNFLKVKNLGVIIKRGQAELLTEILGVCDASCIENIEISDYFSQEVYNEIVRTPQWKNCKDVTLTCKGLPMLNVNLDDFSHLNSLFLEVNAVKLVQNFRNPSDFGVMGGGLGRLNTFNRYQVVRGGIYVIRQNK